MCDEKKTTKEIDVIVESQTTETILIGSSADIQPSSDPAKSGGSITNGRSGGRVSVRGEVGSTDEESEDNKEKKGEVAAVEKKEKELTEVEDKEKKEGEAPLGSSEVDDEVSFKTSHTVTFAYAVETIIEVGSHKVEDIESKMEINEIVNKSNDESETQTKTVEVISQSQIEPKKPEADAEVHRTEIQIDLSKPESSKYDFGSVELVLTLKAKSAESEAAAENENNENGELEEAALMHSAVIILGPTDSETTESTEVLVEDQSQKEIEVDKIAKLAEESDAQSQTVELKNDVKKESTKALVEDQSQEEIKVAEIAKVNEESEDQSLNVELKNDEERANNLIELTEELIISEDNAQVDADKALDEGGVSDKSEELITKMTKLQVESANETCSG